MEPCQEQETRTLKLEPLIHSVGAGRGDARAGLGCWTANLHPADPTPQRRMGRGISPQGLWALDPLELILKALVGF